MVMFRSMRDRFDHTLERKLETKPGADVIVDRELGAATGIVTGRGRRRDWPASEKARVIVESLTPGANVSEVARRNGLSPQRLFGWRREARELFADDHGEVFARSTIDIVTSSKARVAAATFVPPAFVPPAFVPVVVSEKPRRFTSSLVSATAARCANSTEASAQASTIEIVIGGNIVRVIGGVDAHALQTVVEIVRRLACC